MTFEPGIITRIITVTPIVCLVSTIAIANFELLRKLPHFRRFLRRFIALKVGVVAKNYARIPFISTSFTQSCPTLQSLPTALYYDCIFIFIIHCRFGPLVRQWTMRYEAKHNYFKKLSQRLGNFINLPWSLSTRHQQWSCYQWLNNKQIGSGSPEFGPGTMYM